MTDQHPTVLVLGDDPGVAHPLATILTPAGYTVQLARPLAAALPLVPEADLVLVDATFAEADTAQICSAIRARCSDRYLPVLFVTDERQRRERARLFAAGADDYLVHPFDHQELLGRLCVWVRISRRLRQAGLDREWVQASEWERKLADARLECERVRRANAEAHAHMRGVMLAAREMAHRLNNHLTLGVGALELALADPDLPPRLRDLFLQAQEGLDRACHDLAKLQRVARVVTKPTPVGPSLDLDRSLPPAPEGAVGAHDR